MMLLSDNSTELSSEPTFTQAKSSSRLDALVALDAFN